ncbi:MAG: histidine--tRNA ligase [Clostridia bacterium]|nr:histidine--tRNA ligase [Clostridia bacterium]
MITAPKGTIDITPKDVYKWQYVENLLRKITAGFNFKEIRTPVFEHTELFQRGVGDTTDVVSKEMYTFIDKADRSITLRPEGTAGVVRSFLQNGMFADAQPTKLYYIIPCYRYEKPQAGRLREFRQFGVEMFGSYEPSADADVISLVKLILNKLGVKDITLNINNIGCPKCRSEYNKKLIECLEAKKDKLCPTCQERLYKNPMRIFDCKSEICQELIKDAPKMFDSVCDDCKDHFDKVLKYLDAMEIAYNIDKGIVRGLDYYTKTVFEFVSNSIGAQGTVCGGGRYDNLVEELGGKPCAGIGFAMGIERLLLVMENTGIEIPEEETCDIFVAALGENADFKAAKIVADLRTAGIKAEKDHLARSLKAQMKFADKIKAKYTVVLGDNEIENNKVTVKNMKTGEQQETSIENIANMLEI